MISINSDDIRLIVEDNNDNENDYKNFIYCCLAISLSISLWILFVMLM
jgi:hypothetical protein